MRTRILFDELMPLIRCTKKLLKEMGLSSGDLESGTPSESLLGDWHANLIYIERRKCVLFTNDNTLLNFLVPDLSRAQIRTLSTLFREHLQKLLAEEGADEKIQADIAAEYRQVDYAKTNSRSVLGSMNDLASHYKFHILDNGGLKRCDLSQIIKRMNRMPMGAIDYKLPIEVFGERVEQQ